MAEHEVTDLQGEQTADTNVENIQDSETNVNENPYATELARLNDEISQLKALNAQLTKERDEANNSIATREQNEVNESVNDLMTNFLGEND